MLQRLLPPDRALDTTGIASQSSTQGLYNGAYDEGATTLSNELPTFQPDLVPSDVLVDPVIPNTPLWFDIGGSITSENFLTRPGGDFDLEQCKREHMEYDSG
jgi:hypothetical protein